MTNEAPTFRRNDEKRRFEAELDGYVAFADFHLHGDRLTFLHTEVPREIEGRHVGSGMIRWALDYAREQQLNVVPICPFVAAFISRNREYADLIQPQFQSLIR